MFSVHYTQSIYFSNKVRAIRLIFFPILCAYLNYCSLKRETLKGYLLFFIHSSKSNDTRVEWRLTVPARSTSLFVQCTEIKYYRRCHLEGNVGFVLFADSVDSNCCRVEGDLQYPLGQFRFQSVETKYLFLFSLHPFAGYKRSRILMQIVGLRN